MKQSIITIVLSTLSFFSIATTAASPANTLWIFGDSYLDKGTFGMKITDQTSGPEGPCQSNENPSCGPRTFGDAVAQTMGQSLSNYYHIVPYTGEQLNIRHNATAFAGGGARVSCEVNPSPAGSLCISNQLEDKIQSSGAFVDGDRVLINGGNNDFIFSYSGVEDYSDEAQLPQQETFIGLADSFLQAIEKNIGADGETDVKLGFYNVPESLVKMPALRMAFNLTDDPELEQKVQQHFITNVRAYNARMKAGLEKMNFSTVVIDISKYIADIMEFPMEYGFTNGVDPICPGTIVLGNHLDTIGGCTVEAIQKEGCGTLATGYIGSGCGNDYSRFLLSDTLHPSAYAYDNIDLSHTLPALKAAGW